MEILKNLDHDRLKNWFDSKLNGREPFFYTSVDIRDSGFKIAPVDTNLFPAGWNNLSDDGVKSAIEQVKIFLGKYYPNAKKIAILAENFSRNKFYWDNITALKNVIENAGAKIFICVDDAMPDNVETSTAEILKLSKYKIQSSKIVIDGETPDLIILNRDFTGNAAPEFLLLEQPVIPPISMGWHRRRKSGHFISYDNIVKDFASHFSIDPWRLSTFSHGCGQIDFKKGEGLDCVATNVEKILYKIRAKYEEFKVDAEPYVYIKADSGTFGMGIMTVRSGSEVLEMNKKLRNKMDRIKEGVQNTEVLIQEGVPTMHEVDGKTAEPFIYMINNMPVGAILRVNENRDKYGNLNSAGMSFAPANCKEISGACEFTPLGIIARLAGLASLLESDDMLEAA